MSAAVVVVVAVVGGAVVLTGWLALGWLVVRTIVRHEIRRFFLDQLPDDAPVPPWAC